MELEAIATVEHAKIVPLIEAGSEQGVDIHRDIKPANLMLEKDTRQLRIADFGLAKLALESISRIAAALGLEGSEH